MTCHYQYFFICFLLICGATRSLGQSDCVLKKDSDGIKVYTCRAENSKFKAIKTTLNVQATVQQVIDIVLDIEQYNNWQYHTTNARVLDKKNESELIYYTEIVSPWPASNRDLAVQLKVERDQLSKTVFIHTQSIPSYLPEVKGIVRVPMSKSTWTIKPLNETTLSVEFTMQIDPGGSVPAWLINMVAAEAPHESFLNFKKKIEQSLKIDR